MQTGCHIDPEPYSVKDGDSVPGQPGAVLSARKRDRPLVHGTVGNVAARAGKNKLSASFLI